MLYTDLQSQVIVRCGTDTTSTFITETQVRDWLDEAHKWATGYKKWPFTEYMDKSGAFTNGTETYAYPNVNYKTDSIRLMKVGSYLFEKKIFSDYLQYREDYPSGTDKIYSDYGRTIYVNPNCVAGTIYCFGQLTPPVLGLVGSSTSSTVFNSYDDEGNDAVIDKTCSYAYRKMKKFQEALDFEQRARATLDELWKRVQDEQAMYQTKDRALFERVDIINGDYYGDESNPLRF